MSKQHLATQTLENQLTLNVFDASKKMAADRWRVEVVLEIEVPVHAKWFNEALAPPAPAEALAAALGDSVLYEYRDQRTFVDTAEKDALVNQMQADLLAMAPRYYGHPNFAGRLIIKRYLEKTGGRKLG